jgi:hypothetical protein
MFCPIACIFRPYVVIIDFWACTSSKIRKNWKTGHLYVEKFKMLTPNGDRVQSVDRNLFARRVTSTWFPP